GWRPLAERGGRRRPGAGAPAAPAAPELEAGAGLRRAEVEGRRCVVRRIRWAGVDRRLRRRVVDPPARDEVGVRVPDGVGGDRTYVVEAVANRGRVPARAVRGGRVRPDRRPRPRAGGGALEDDLPDAGRRVRTVRAPRDRPSHTR